MNVLLKSQLWTGFYVWEYVAMGIYSIYDHGGFV